MKEFCLTLTILAALACQGLSDRKMADEAATALMKYYDQNQGFFKNGKVLLWWNGANCITSIADYMLLTGNKAYISQMNNSFVKARNWSGIGAKEFCNDYVDDDGWWGLAWVRVYDVTHDNKYLQMAQHIHDCMYQYHDNLCKGGLHWKTDRGGKNAIENELYIKLAASLHNRIKGDTKYLNQAKDVWNWFKNSGMINSQHLINDGLKGLQACHPEGPTFTYNQGVILGGLVELHKATNDHNYLSEAQAIADAVVKSSSLSPNGILREPGEGDDCDNQGASFKGAFIRGLGELSKALNNRYHDYLTKNVQSAHDHDRNNQNQYGNHWSGPFKATGPNCQHSALDLINAAL